MPRTPSFTLSSCTLTPLKAEARTPPKNNKIQPLLYITHRHRPNIRVRPSKQSHMKSRERPKSAQQAQFSALAFLRAFPRRTMVNDAALWFWFWSATATLSFSFFFAAAAAAEAAAAAAAVEGGFGLALRALLAIPPPVLVPVSGEAGAGAGAGGREEVMLVSSMPHRCASRENRASAIAASRRATSSATRSLMAGLRTTAFSASSARRTRARRSVSVSGVAKRVVSLPCEIVRDGDGDGDGVLSDISGWRFSQSCSKLPVFRMTTPFFRQMDVL